MMEEKEGWLTVLEFARAYAARHKLAKIPTKQTVYGWLSKRPEIVNEHVSGKGYRIAPSALDAPPPKRGRKKQNTSWQDKPIQPSQFTEWINQS